jgi:hypothetical protein
MVFAEWLRFAGWRRCRNPALQREFQRRYMRKPDLRAPARRRRQSGATQPIPTQLSATQTEATQLNAKV